ncbi:type II secretion system F family protein [Candidatus Kaiserbacteria bacterium]|nr:type II secretion system F family protein [Candidatus Kaiserbacteria bacterium]
MAIFEYTGIDAEGNERQGTIDAVNIDLAIAALQRRSIVISKIDPAGKKASLLNFNVSLFNRVTNADIVMISRQITTLFEAQVSALRAFELLAAEARTPTLAAKLTEITSDIQSGSSISMALSRHPDMFSPFYVSMVRAGEESGSLDKTFEYLAGYLDRNYEMVTKARNALVYPAFIVVTFIAVMILMMTVIVPHLSDMLTDTGQELPIYTKAVIGLSDFMSRYILLILVVLGASVAFFINYSRTENGKTVLARARLEIPAVGVIYQKIALSRIADNLATMLKSGIQILHALEITASVVGDPVYESVINEATADVKSGMPLSESLRKHRELPGIMVAMIKIGEETGSMGPILDTMAKFYRREVDGAVDTLIGLIEPLMIVILALGVAFLLAAVLLPIYNIAASF